MPDRQTRNQRPNPLVFNTVDSARTVWRKNGVSQYNLMGVVICALSVLILGAASAPGQFAQSPFLGGYSPFVCGLIVSSPFFLLGFGFLLTCSLVQVDTVAGTITRKYGLRPLLITRRYPLSQAKYVEVDVGRGIYSVDLVFQDDGRLVLTPGESELGVEKVLELAEMTRLPVKPTPRVVAFNPAWLRRAQSQGNILS